MQNTIYAKYRSQEMADQAFLELLQRGVNLLDLVVITRRTFQNPDFDTDDGRLSIYERQEVEQEPLPSVASLPPIPYDEALPPNRDPFEVTPAGVRILDSLRYPGDLSECLHDLGFAHREAQDVENTVLNGGAALILRVPSGPVEEFQAWEAIERNGGAILNPIQSRPYLG